jgi:hypothetical protein
MISEIKMCYNFVVLETFEVNKIWEVKTNKNKNKGNLGINSGWSATCTCTTLFNSLNFSRPQTPNL